ncbi:MAG: hypothetical protein ACK46Q_01455 [Hyphomonas sp.]
MNLEGLEQRFHVAAASIERDVRNILHDLSVFVRTLSHVEQAMLAGLGVLMLFYLLLPGASETSQGNGRAFTGLLLIVVAVGLSAGWLMSGRISF